MPESDVVIRLVPEERRRGLIHSTPLETWALKPGSIVKVDDYTCVVLGYDHIKSQTKAGEPIYILWRTNLHWIRIEHSGIDTIIREAE